MKKLFFTLIIICLGLFNCCTSNKNNQEEKLYDSTLVSSVEFAKMMKIGWNYGNQFDSYSMNKARETAWGNPMGTQELFNLVANSGFKTVRIPITWLGNFDEKANYTIDSAYIARVKEVVDYANNASMIAIINIHHDGADSKNWLKVNDKENQAKILEIYNALWRQIAIYFKDKTPYELIFESYNELHDGGWGHGENTKDGGIQYDFVNQLAQNFVNTVRQEGSKNNINRYLGISGYCTNPKLTIENLIIPQDKVKDRILVSFHDYTPQSYTLEGEFDSWPMPEGSKNKWGGKIENEDDIYNIMKSMSDKYVKNGIGVYMGECGSSRHLGHEKQREYYNEVVTYCAVSQGICPIFWDNNNINGNKESSGIFDRQTAKLHDFSQGLIDAMMRAADPKNQPQGYNLEWLKNQNKK